PGKPHRSHDVSARLLAAVRLAADEEAGQHEERARADVSDPAIDRLVQVRDNKGRLGNAARRLAAAHRACHVPPRAGVPGVLAPWLANPRDNVERLPEQGSVYRV